MPSLVMYLAIAKKYMEKHPEENEEEFIEGILAPDRKRNVRAERHKLHYGSSHNPNLNEFYKKNGLGSSYNRGYFLNLLTDYLFYNKYLQEYSADIFYDFKRMNKRIEDKYEVHVPEELENRVKYKDGELKVVDEDEVYKFIDSVGQLDLEKYKEQVSERQSKAPIKITGMKEGLLCKHKEENVLNSYDEMYFYGFENNYGALIQRVMGFSGTKGAEDGLYQITPVGIAVKPSKIMELTEAYISDIREELSDETSDRILELCQNAIGKEIERDIDLNFERVEKDDIKTILRLIKGLSERKTEKEITDGNLNSDFIEQEDIEIE